MGRLIVSISGIRGIIGDGLGPREAVRFGLAFGTYLKGGPVVLGRDSRPSGPMLADALRAGLLATGCRVIDLGILSTPGISVMMRHLKAAGGAVITASHNPSPYNGIKLLSAKGHGLTQTEGQSVVALYERQAFAEKGTDGVGAPERNVEGPQVHVERVLAAIDAINIRAKRFSVVVDAVNGAGGAEMSMLLDRLGCECVLINGEPTGRFGRGPEPTPENLGDLGRAVRERGAAVGLALDPDADRLALVDEKGRAIGEEYTLALAARHRLTQARGPLACNLSTSRMMDDVAREAGVVLHRTPVGEVNVAEAIGRENCLIGGEGNGGVIDPRIAPVRNSLAGAALVLEMMAVRGRTLSELCGEWPVYTMVKDKVELGDRKPAAVLEAARRRFADARMDERDGLYLAWPDGWLHVRVSNTEPIMRILAEADREETARRRVAEVKALALCQT
jgi:phosphomannomutase